MKQILKKKLKIITVNSNPFLGVKIKSNLKNYEQKQNRISETKN